MAKKACGKKTGRFVKYPLITECACGKCRLPTQFGRLSEKAQKAVKDFERQSVALACTLAADTTLQRKKQVAAKFHNALRVISLLIRSNGEDSNVD